MVGQVTAVFGDGGLWRRGMRQRWGGGAACPGAPSVSPSSPVASTWQPHGTYSTPRERSSCRLLFRSLLTVCTCQGPTKLPKMTVPLPSWAAGALCQAPGKMAMARPYSLSVGHIWQARATLTSADSKSAQEAMRNVVRTVCIRRRVRRQTSCMYGLVTDYQFVNRHRWSTQWCSKYSNPISPN